MEARTWGMVGCGRCGGLGSAGGVILSSGEEGGEV